IGGVVLPARLEKRQGLPKALGRQPSIPARSRIEDELEPLLGFGEALVLAELGRDEERNVEEELPVVGGVRPVEVEVHATRGIGEIWSLGPARAISLEKRGSWCAELLLSASQERLDAVAAECLTEVADERVLERLERPESVQEGPVFRSGKRGN